LIFEMKERDMSKGKSECRTREIYKAIIGITEDLIKDGGIGKTRVNEQQHFRFRGIEDIQNALAPLLVKHKVCIVPTFSNRRTELYESKTGGKLFSTVVEGVFELISAVDGSCVRVTIPGEAMDSGDKSTNKAMSMAMKYASLLTFCIPTEGEDADGTSHDLKNGRKADSDVSSGGTRPAPALPSATGANASGSGRGHSETSDPPHSPKRELTKVVRIEGRPVRTAGVEAEQLQAIWKAADQQGSETVAQFMKEFGVEKSVYLTKEEAGRLVERLKLAVPESNGNEDAATLPV
jgi:hypothetical protein